MSRYLVDALDLGHNTKGISRVLSALVPELHARLGDALLIATTDRGAQLLDLPGEQVLRVPRGLQSVWEQYGLPRLALRHNVAATYSHREAGAMWGPPLVLHVTENPEVRWAREPAAGLRSRSRRAYSRAIMARSLTRAAVVAASVPSVRDQLLRDYGQLEVRLLPLGVDVRRFCPVHDPREDVVFHLGSPDPRDQTLLVVHAYARAAGLRPDLPPLVVGGGLGAEVGARVAHAVTALALTGRVRITGRLSDEQLSDLYRHALVVLQPASDEGFGLQPLEALASGAPLVVGDATAVTDVVGAAAVSARPNEASLADALVSLHDDAARRQQLRRLGPAVAAAYSWGGTADLACAALEDAGQSRPAARRGPFR